MQLVLHLISFLCGPLPRFEIRCNYPSLLVRISVVSLAREREGISALRIHAQGYTKERERERDRERNKYHQGATLEG